MSGSLGLAMAAFGTGLALSSAPGPVQVVIVTEAANGGTRRGFRALSGTVTTFTALLALLAMGASISPPTGPFVHILEVAGGVVLLWIAWDGHRDRLDAQDDRRHGLLPPEVRGALSIVANPAAWLFLAAVAAPLLSTAADQGGSPAALLVAAALAVGAAGGDSLMVLAGGIGLPRLGDRARRGITLFLRLLLAGLGIWLLIRGVRAVTVCMQACG